MNEDDFLDEEEEEKIEMISCLFEKKGMISFLNFKKAKHGAMIIKVDPREERPQVQIYDCPIKGLHWYERSLRKTVKNGWKLVHKGEPNLG